jgi:hypothetical protein
MAAQRHHHEQRLSRRNDAAICVHRKLLNHAVDRRGGYLECGSPLGLDHVLGETGGLLLGLGQLFETGAAILGSSLGAAFGQRRNFGLGFATLGQPWF